MVNRLFQLYLDHLTRGFIVLQYAYDIKNEIWIGLEIELLHNIPSLVGENNIHRHQYFINEEVEVYRERIYDLGEEAISKMNTYYLPIWKEMRAALSEFLEIKKRHSTENQYPDGAES